MKKASKRAEAVGTSGVTVWTAEGSQDGLLGIYGTPALALAAAVEYVRRVEDLTCRNEVVINVGLPGVPSFRAIAADEVATAARMVVGTEGARVHRSGADIRHGDVYATVKPCVVR